MEINAGPHSDKLTIVIKNVQYNLPKAVSDLLLNISKERDEFYYLLDEVHNNISNQRLMGQRELILSLDYRIITATEDQREFRKIINDNN